jgi:predicted signal transduction protein with EAL and GGDEF domain
MVMQNVSRAIKVLKAIQHRGIRLAIDDFGTGYWSMSLMKQFPIDTIKIDRCFVRDLADDSEDQTIAQAIIRMGEALGMMSLPKAWKPPARRPSCAIRAAMKCRVFCSANRSRRNNWPICSARGCAGLPAASARARHRSETRARMQRSAR